MESACRRRSLRFPAKESNLVLSVQGRACYQCTSRDQCRRGDLDPHGCYPTRSSTSPVYLFQHFDISSGPRQAR